jgi:type III secretory pathway component EscU
LNELNKSIHIKKFVKSLKSIYELGKNILKCIIMFGLDAATLALLIEQIRQFSALFFELDLGLNASSTHRISSLRRDAKIDMKT